MLLKSYPRLYEKVLYYYINAHRVKIIKKLLFITFGKIVWKKTKILVIKLAQSYSIMMLCTVKEMRKLLMANRGSEFRKWDLHLHSPYTILNNNFEKLMDVGGAQTNIEKFISKIKENDISAVGLTNYFNFTADDFNLKKRLQKEGILTFLNLEVRLSNVNNSNQLFDYHIIFDNTLEDEVIANLLGNLKATVGDTDKAFNRLDKREIEDKAFISFDSLISTLEKDKELNGRYLKGFLTRGHGNARVKSEAVYENICVKSDFIIHSSCDSPENCKDRNCNHNNAFNDRKYWLGKSSQETKYIKPMLQSSDAHSLENIGKRFSWIKADLSFEGLKQIKYEPEYRISLEKEKPHQEKDELIIDRIEYAGKRWDFSENLNAIIGGRSTGKSTLLNTIAKKLGIEIEKDANYLKNIESFQVYWKDGKEENSRKIQYIPQEYMFSLAKDDDKLSDLVMEIISSKELDAELRGYNQKCSNLQDEIRNLLYQYKEVLRIQQELKKPEEDKDATLDRIKMLEESKKKVLCNGIITDEERANFDRDKKTLESLEQENVRYKNDLNYIKNIAISKIILDNTDIVKPSEKLADRLNVILGELNKEAQEKYNQEKIKITNKLHGLIDENNQKIDSIKKSGIMQKYTKFLDSNREIARLDDSIKNEKKILTDIEQFINQENQLDVKKRNLKEKLINNYKKYSDFRNELQESFEISDNNKLEISIDFYLKDLYAEFDYINGRGHSKQNFIDKLSSNFNDVLENIFDDDSLSFNGNKDKLSHIENFLSTNFYSYRFNIKYQDDDFEQMSPGKKAFIVLKLILDFSDSRIPVLIDQPEDSLDNRAIYNELTAYIKKTKLKRQIIVVTHNPNIVVAGDCENVIVANQQSKNSPNENNRTFDYINGALENSSKNEKSCYVLQKYSIREHVCDILEGGKQAFLTREEKYDIGS